MRKRTKFLLLRASIILIFSILAGRIWYVQVVMGSYYQKQADTSKIRIEPVQALRGIIYDRYGRQLVYNAPSWNVMVVPHGIPSTGAWSIYRELSRLLHNDPSPRAIAKIVRDNQWRAYAPAVVKANVTPETAMIIKQLHSDLPGVRADPSSVRQYVNDGRLSLAHVLGYVGEIGKETLASSRKLYPREQFGPSDQVGQAGIEVSLDPYLHGVNGSEEVEVDSGERPVRVLRKGHTVPGDSVYLTIDANLQREVSKDLGDALDHVGLHRGVAIVEDVRTGSILSLVSLPSFNNNWFAGGISTAHYRALTHDPLQPLFNLATAGQFAPGSTFKLVTATAALQTGAVTASTTVDDTGSITLGGTTFTGWNPNGLGTMNIVSALSHSSDIYFWTVAGGNPNIQACPPAPCIGPDRLAYWARQYGLGKPSGIELPDDAAGLIPTPSWFNHLPAGILRNPGETWHIGHTYNMAIGQGQVQTTPLQMINVASTIANGGTLYQPHIVDRIVGRVTPRTSVSKTPSTVQPFVPTIVRRNLVSPANLALIQEGMHESVDLPNWEGTSYLVQDRRIDAAGKTGTAEAKLPDGTWSPHAWWVGYAPFKNPKIAVIVMVPNANSEGAYLAAPIAHKIFEDYFHLKPTKRNWLDDVTTQITTFTGAQ